ncbi:MAG: DUF2905 domain-containing protein [Chloroflexota bacterium]
MNPVSDLGRVLLILGAMIFVLGLLLVLIGRVPGTGRLPGDIVIHRDNVTIWIPVATMIILSVGLSVLMFVLSLILRR